jgi:hypothetical protein
MNMAASAAAGKAAEFDDAERIISQAKLDVHYVPGEHDFIDEERKFYRERYGRGAKGAGWYSFDAGGVHNGHIHQVMQKVEGNVTFHTARSTAFPQPAPGTAPSPRPDEGRRRQVTRPARHRQHLLQAGQ